MKVSMMCRMMIGWIFVAAFGMSVSHAAQQARSEQPSVRSNQKVQATTNRADLVRRSVRNLLERSPAFRKLSPAKQQSLTKNLEAVGCACVADEVQNRPAIANSVDFPAFVAGLIEGVFNANVEASIRQMEAYADLINDVGSSLGPDACAEPGKIDPTRRKAILERVRRELKFAPSFSHQSSHSRSLKNRL